MGYLQHKRKRSLTGPTSKGMSMETDVVIVGGGPAGAAAAGELGRRGIRCVIIDDTDGVFREARLHNVSVRTAELLRIWGAEDDLRQCGWPLDHPLDIAFMTRLDGHEIARIPWVPIGETPAPVVSPTFTYRCPQCWFNPIIHRFAKSTGRVDFRWLHRFESYKETESGVVVRAVDLQSGEEIVIAASYLIGADGARSSVQKASGIKRTGSEALGHSAEMLVESKEFAGLVKDRRAGRFIFVDENGISLTINPFDGRDIFRVTLMAEPSQVSEADMAAALTRAAGHPVEHTPVTPIVPWVNRETTVDTYRAGRVFLVGDAAHTWPPMGGYGANTGMLDSFDIAWKLAAVLQGWGGEGLLEAYEHERRLHADRMRAIAVGIFEDWLKVGPMVQGRQADLEGADEGARLYREKLGEDLVSLLSREFNALGGPLGYRYEGSPLIIADGTPEPPDSDIDYHPVARPGHLTPHAWLSDGTAVLDHFGRGFVLFDLGAPVELVKSFSVASEELGIPLEVIADPDLPADQFGSELVLSRPDGHVAFRWQDEEFDPAQVLRRVAGFNAAR